MIWHERIVLVLFRDLWKGSPALIFAARTEKPADPRPESLQYKQIVNGQMFLLLLFHLHFRALINTILSMSYCLGAVNIANFGLGSGLVSYDSDVTDQTLIYFQLCDLILWDKGG